MSHPLFTTLAGATDHAPAHHRSFPPTCILRCSLLATKYRLQTDSLCYFALWRRGGGPSYALALTNVASPCSHRVQRWATKFINVRTYVRFGKQCLCCFAGRIQTRVISPAKPRFKVRSAGRMEPTQILQDHLFCLLAGGLSKHPHTTNIKVARS